MRGRMILGTMTVLTATAAGAAPAPAPGRIETYRDWTIGCDNLGRCEAVGLMPDSATPDAALMVRIEREAGASAEPVIWLQTDMGRLSGVASLQVDGRKVAEARLAGGNGKLTGPQAAALAIAMARGTKMELRLGGTALPVPSLAGSAAALRYMDAQQGRAGTTTALIATGTLGPQAVKAAPAMPMVRVQLPPAGIKPAELWADERTRAVRIAECTEDYEAGQTIELFALSRGQTLALVPCGAGAYNFSTVALIASGTTGRRSFVKARFDYAPGFGNAGAGGVMLVNASWSEKEAQLSSYAKGRGLGDCGNSEDYVWDGAMFRLTQAAAMNECRGVADWITIFRARVGR